MTAPRDRWQQVARISLAAVERNPADRGAFLREASAGDEGLRREVESLLVYEGADPWIERPAAAVDAPMPNTSAPSAVLTGRPVRRYRDPSDEPPTRTSRRRAVERR